MCAYNNEMIIFIGIQASGKTTFYKQHFQDYVHINLDTLHTRNKERIALEESFQAHKNIVVDNTNPTVEDRANYIRQAKAQGYHVVGYFFQSCIKDCVTRNEEREGKAKVPKTAIAATSNKLQMPSYEEGFKELYFVYFKDGQMKVEQWRTDYIGNKV